MRKIFAVTSAAVMFVFSASSLARAKEPTSSEINAFIDAYGIVESIRITTEEQVAFFVESGKLSPAVAACIKERVSLGEARKIVAPIVAKSFTDPVLLKETTAFFASPTGKKMNEYNFGVLREAVRRALRRLPQPETGLPPSFTPADIQAAGDFNNSPAGIAFQRFVKEGLPKIQKITLLQDAYEACTAK